LKSVNEQLKFSRSISIPKLKKNREHINCNILYAKNQEGKESENYIPNPDTFRKLDTDRGYESQGINNLLVSDLPEKKYFPVSKKMSIIEPSKFKLPLHLVPQHPLSLVQNSSTNTGRSESK
jgi:hypothetical protein